MNWRGGFFRLWIVVASIWMLVALVISGFVGIQIKRDFEQDRRFDWVTSRSFYSPTIISDDAFSLAWNSGGFSALYVDGRWYPPSKTIYAVSPEQMSEFLEQTPDGLLSGNKVEALASARALHDALLSDNTVARGENVGLYLVNTGYARLGPVRSYKRQCENAECPGPPRVWLRIIGYPLAVIFGAGALPMGLLFGLGWTLLWIAHGFRPKG